VFTYVVEHFTLFSYVVELFTIVFLRFQVIPMPVLYGVFFYMGFSAMRGMQVNNLIDEPTC